MTGIKAGEVRLTGVSRRYKVVHERNNTLKETILRRRRIVATDLWVLNDVDITIEPGESVGIVGRNGTGKSTLLKMVAGIIPPQAGSVEAGGVVASLLELGAGFHPDFSGYENIFMQGALYGLDRAQIQERMNDIVAFAELADFIEMPVKTYSSGMFMRLGFSIAAHVDADIMLLDEILAVGDATFQGKCANRISDFRKGGGTILFVSHDPNMVEQICNRAILLDQGRVVRDGATPEVIETYHRLLAGTTAEPNARTAKPEAGDAVPRSLPAQTDLGGWGTGDAAIVDIELIGLNGPTDRFLSGDPLTVRLTIEAERRIVAPHVGVGVRTHDSTMCFGSNTRLDDAGCPDIVGRCVVEYRVRELPLHEGQFNIVVAVTSTDDSVVYHWIDDAATFSVLSRRAGVGFVAVETDWSFSGFPLSLDGQMRLP